MPHIECENIDCVFNRWRKDHTKYKCEYIGVVNIDETGCKTQKTWGR
jgi:hypothetical protein